MFIRGLFSVLFFNVKFSILYIPILNMWSSIMLNLKVQMLLIKILNKTYYKTIIRSDQQTNNIIFQPINMSIPRLNCRSPFLKRNSVFHTFKMNSVQSKGLRSTPRENFKAPMMTLNSSTILRRLDNTSMGSTQETKRKQYDSCFISISKPPEDATVADVGLVVRNIQLNTCNPSRSGGFRQQLYLNSSNISPVRCPSKLAITSPDKAIRI